MYQQNHYEVYLRPEKEIFGNEKHLKMFKNVLDTLDESSDPGVGAGERFAIRAKELEIENDYDNIKYLENKLNDTSLSFDEHKKILDDISQAKENIPKKELELSKLKKDLEKRTRIYQASKIF